MAHRGKIDYMEVPFDHVEWNYEFKALRGDREIGGWGLKTVLRRLAIIETGHGWQGLTFDGLDRDRGGLRCFVVGRAQMSGADHPYKEVLETDHFVLLVSPASNDDNCTTYERVGVGTLKGSQIVWQIFDEVEGVID